MLRAGNRAKGATPSLKAVGHDQRSEYAATPRGWYAHYIKPVFDRLGGLILLILSLPLILISALVVRFSLGRPIFLWPPP